MIILFSIPESTGLVEGENHLLIIEGLNRVWNRRIVIVALLIWIGFLSDTGMLYKLFSIDSMILYILLFLAYIGSLQHVIIIQQTERSLTLKRYVGNVMIFLKIKEIHLDNPRVNFVVYSKRPDARAKCIIIENEQKESIRIMNNRVLALRDEFSIIGIQNFLVSHYTGKIKD
ncbi:MAG: hypothetical protein INQ03_14825 [Candidatus Heimdallarchaeota archaeon]|nr:hypothetical protein [Candidatus Heimdallarchaeota archaeon]